MAPRNDRVLTADEARPLVFGLEAFRCAACGLCLVLSRGRPRRAVHDRCGGRWRAMSHPQERMLMLRILTRRML